MFHSLSDHRWSSFVVSIVRTFLCLVPSMSWTPVDVYRPVSDTSWIRLPHGFSPIISSSHLVVSDSFSSLPLFPSSFLLLNCLAIVSGCFPHRFQLSPPFPIVAFEFPTIAESQDPFYWPIGPINIRTCYVEYLVILPTSPSCFQPSTSTTNTSQPYTRHWGQRGSYLAGKLVVFWEFVTNSLPLCPLG